MRRRVSATRRINELAGTRHLNEGPDAAAIEKEMKDVRQIFQKCQRELSKVRTPAMDKYFGASTADDLKEGAIDRALRDLDAELKDIKGR